VRRGRDVVPVGVSPVARRASPNPCKAAGAIVRGTTTPAAWRKVTGGLLPGAGIRTVRGVTVLTRLLHHAQIIRGAS